MGEPEALSFKRFYGGVLFNMENMDLTGRLGVILGLRSVEPAALIPALAPGDGDSWDLIRSEVAHMLDAGGRSQTPEQVDLVCRWLGSHVIEPGSQDSRAAQARLVAASLPAAIRTTAFVVPSD